MLWRILVFYIGAIFVIAAVVPVGSAGLTSPFAAVLEAAGMPGAATAITLVAVAALLSALNANLYGASRMAYSLAERGEAPRLLASVSKARVPVVAVLASVAFGVVTVVLELAFPSCSTSSVRPACWCGRPRSSPSSHCASAPTATARSFPADAKLPVAHGVWSLVILAAIFTVGFIGEDSRPQLLSTFGLVALLAVANWLRHRSGKVAAVVEAAEGDKQPVLID